jgi:cytochrome c oxidase cbb3-type subunit 3
MLLFIQNQKDIIPNMTAAEFGLVVFSFLMCIALILITLGLMRNTKAIIKALNKNSEEDLPEMQNRSIWEKMGSLKPLSMEHKLVMDHKYDGITELDNPTPPWFMYLFYGTILIAVFYLAGYHLVGNGKTMENEYAEQVAIAEIERNEYMKKIGDKINENTVVALKDAKSLDAGQKIYMQSCLACHGDKGQGGVGPNLTDEYWIHGGTVKNVYHTISEGVPEKGMISWKKTLNPVQMQQVTSFLATLVGTKPANGKEPQGEKEKKI